MSIDFKLPDLGENVDSGDVVNVLVKEGEEIRADQSVMEIETGKAVVELPCPYAGKITKIHVKKGAKVKVGQPLLSLEGNGKPPSAKEPAQGKAEPAKPAPPKPADKPPAPPAKAEAKPAEVRRPAPAAVDSQAAAKTAGPKPKSRPAAPDRKTPLAGPATRRLARELGVDLALVSGSGPGGRITEDDVKAAVRRGGVAAEPAGGEAVRRAAVDGVEDRDNWGPVRRQQMASIRKTIAINMARNAATIPHVTNFDDADITELERIRKGGLVDYVDSSVKLTMMAFVMKAVAQSLRLHPLVNASVDMENEQIIYKEYVNIGVAVDTDRGLVVPVIRDVDRLSIPRVAKALTAVAESARTGQLSLEDMRGATFTISNLGAIGGTYSTPIINAPDVAILLVGRSRKLPVVIDDKIEVRLMMPLSLSYDHRIVDGATAARFLNEVIAYLKVPGRLLLAP
jgi:pyruvate dehydrogenase E2 component (dihydrolipoamide acetyltransferase)